MGQVITGIVANDANAQIVAGIDLRDDGHNLYPVFASLEECNVEADVIIDFASAKAEDTLVDYIKKTKIPAVICTTGLSDEQIASINEASKSVAILRSANMSLGINTLFKLLHDAARAVPLGASSFWLWCFSTISISKPADANTLAASCKSLMRQVEQLLHLQIQ